MDYFDAHGSPLNQYGIIQGRQSSYRAEVRTLLQALLNAVQPTLLLCDCQAVVNAYDDLLQEKELDHDIEEHDLWVQVQNAVRAHIGIVPLLPCPMGSCSFE